MRTRPPSPEHQEAVSRRLALLSAELAGQAGQAGQAPAPGYAMPEEHTRVRAAPAGPSPEPPEAPVAPLPEPGRHASRSFLLGAGQLAVVAVLVAVALAVTTWWVVRGDPEPVAAPALGAAGLATPASSLPASVAASPSAPGPASASGEVTVDVAGKVRRPGIQVLPAGSRVVDAIEAAGGARPGVDLTSLNLARVLTDGEQVLVGLPPPVGAIGAVPSSGPSSGAAAGPLVNLNTATSVELEALPEVGPVTAQSILSWREEHGGFTSVDELLEVDGIGDATLATIRPHVTV